MFAARSPLPPSAPPASTADAPVLDTGLVWFRRDLRAEDHSALSHALQQCRQVHAVFVFDPALLDPLPRRDRRVEFIVESLRQLDAALRDLALATGSAAGSAVGLIVLQGDPTVQVPALAQQLGAQAVYANEDYEPATRARDAAVQQALAAEGITLRLHQDHVLTAPDELRTGTRMPYTVFTPYYRKWLTRLDARHLAVRPVAPHAAALAARPAVHARAVPTLADIGFEPTDLSQLPLPAGVQGAQTMWQDFLARMAHYDTWRDFPARRGPSYLGVHLRFGTLSIREVARAAWALQQQGQAGATKWLAELCWRDFYSQVLWHHPEVVDQALRPRMRALRWEDGATGDARFAAWCEARTGIPIVDAAMRQLHASGYMHNRLRMIAGSFLVKHLGVDWRRGEAHFALHLNDFDLASNNGGWQWVAGTGCDAQPWFRIFNPVSQSRRFDPEGAFIRRYVPELAALPPDALHAPWLAQPATLAAAGIRLGHDYPLPVIDLDTGRRAALARLDALPDGDSSP